MFIKLFKEVFSKYRDQWLEERKNMGWKQNLHLVLFGAAGIVFIILILEILL